MASCIDSVQEVESGGRLSQEVYCIDGPGDDGGVNGAKSPIPNAKTSTPDVAGPRMASGTLNSPLPPCPITTVLPGRWEIA